MKFHMRRRDKQITEEAAMKKILKSAKYVTLAMSMDNEPYLVSLSHGYDESRNCIYFHCATEGKKLEILKANNRVWGQAMLDYGYVQNKCDHSYATVHFAGKAAFVEDPDEKRRAVECMIRQLEEAPEAFIASFDFGRLKKETVVGRIDIEYMTGKKSPEVAL